MYMRFWARPYMWWLTDYPLPDTVDACNKLITSDNYT